jgi:drug/metabolite transporter (DMT)-like permease
MTAAAVTSDDHARNRSVGVMLAALGAGLFSLKGVVIKLAFAEGMGVSQLLTLRMAMSLPFFLGVGIWTFIRSGRRPSAKLYAAAAGLGVLSYYISSYLNFVGLQYVSAQLERLILYIYPTMVALLAWVFLKEKITSRHVIALVLAYAGVIILFGAEIGHQGKDVIWGAGIIFVGAFLYAIYVTFSRSVISRMGSALFTSFAMSAASLAFLAQAGVELAVGHPQPPITGNGFMLSFVLATVCTVIPSFMIADAIGRIGPGPMSAIGGVGPVVAAWAAVVFLNEPFGWAHVAAMALTIAGVWLLARAPKAKPVLPAVTAPEKVEAASPTP